MVINRGRLRIGELAAKTGVSAHTIRFYESIGVLPSPGRTEAGYRMYDNRDVERVRFTRRAKEVGLNLSEIGEIIALRDNGETPCDRVRDIVQEKLGAVRRQVEALQALELDLSGLLQEVPASRLPETCYCGLIEYRHRATRQHQDACSP